MTRRAPAMGCELAIRLMRVRLFVDILLGHLNVRRYYLEHRVLLVVFFLGQS